MIYKTKKNAFTLIEVLVSIAIFIIILGIVIVNYKYSERVTELRLVAYDIEDSIKFTQNMSFTGQKINDQIPSSYGIYVDKSNNSYIIYGDRQVTADPNSGVLGFDSGDSKYSTTQLPTNIKILDLKCSSASNLLSLDISFMPPRGSMRINNLNTYPICYIEIKNLKINGYWRINMIPGSSKVWTQFFNN